jgi:hypothetical protein
MSGQKSRRGNRAPKRERSVVLLSRVLLTVVLLTEGLRAHHRRSAITTGLSRSAKLHQFDGWQADGLWQSCRRV